MAYSWEPDIRGLLEEAKTGTGQNQNLCFFMRKLEEIQLICSYAVVERSYSV